MLTRFRIPTADYYTSLGALLHTSVSAAARPKYDNGRSGFVPARARLVEEPSRNRPRSGPKSFLTSPKSPRSPTPRFGRTTRTDAQPRRDRERKRKPIMELPTKGSNASRIREPAPHMSRTPKTPSKPQFSTPPLIPGLVEQINQLLGRRAKPSPIQELSLSHFFRKKAVSAGGETLLAAETGSGKSLAYLLPLVQGLKVTESRGRSTRSSSLPAPRALILVPTHELARQLKSTLSYLTHPPDTKLRAVCVSSGTVTSLSGRETPQVGNYNTNPSGEIHIAPASHATRSLDVVIGTPARILDLTRPSGKYGVGPKRPGQDETVTREVDRDIKMSLRKIEWVVVDEADVLFDPDFCSWTEAILGDIRAARSSARTLPFNLILTTATISAQLNNYLREHFPQLKRLTTPDLHRLPASLKTEYVAWDRRPGNRNPAILRKIQDTWAAEAREHPNWKEQSKIIIFCNRSRKVEELGEYLESQGIRCVSMTSDSDNRQRGSNKHIEAFLKSLPCGKHRQETTERDTRKVKSGIADQPDVLITTSLLSRGLDFTPQVRSVFIVDEPRNDVDFIHRAGRAGRAGREGRVVVFTDQPVKEQTKRVPWAMKKISAFNAV